ncbi:hypothetical protein [uncultured Kordia sp.]|uniref:hypothetical protein n=1 Tax=uncultured Kordia sp. TaxID=507699 RepID=UPI002630F955|nr:hypothetical protein [uncultured Kordia sp.]
MKFLKRHIVIVLTVLVLFLSCETKQSRENTLKELKYSLNAVELVGSKFNQRNPYLRSILKKSEQDKNNFDKSDFVTINKISKEVNQIATEQLALLHSYKELSPNKELFNATIKQIEVTKDFNEIGIKFLKTLEDTIDSNDLEYQKSLTAHNQRSKQQNRLYKNTLSDFYEEYNISQAEIDAIMSTIKNGNK